MNALGITWLIVILSAAIVGPAVAVTASAPGSPGHAPALGMLRNTFTSTGNWAGSLYCPGGDYRSLCQEGAGTVQGAYGCWNIPQIAQTLPPGQPGSEQALSIWVGIGGTMGSDLAQIGTIQSSTTGTLAWWETLPSSAQVIPLPLAEENLVCAEVELMGDDSFGHELWFFSLQDLSTGTQWNNSGDLEACGETLLWPACNPPDLSSAEWIVETPELSGQLASLPAFAEVTFSSLFVHQDGAWSSLAKVATPSNLQTLELESTLAPTSPAYMTWVQGAITGEENPSFSVEYLAYLSAVSSSASEDGDWVQATLVAADTISPEGNPPPLSLAWTSTAPDCPWDCAQAGGDAIVGTSIGSGGYLLSLDPTVPEANGTRLAAACLWWAAPGSSNGSLAVGSLRLECAGGSAANGSRPEATPIAPQTGLSTPTIVVLVLSALLIEVIVLQRRRARPARKRKGRWVKGGSDRGRSVRNSQPKGGKK